MGGARPMGGGAHGNVCLCLSLQHGAENGGKRKKDRNLDELKKEVALVSAEGPATMRHATVVKETELDWMCGARLLGAAVKSGHA